MNYPAIPREFFNGDCFDAYRILGAHPCSDNGTEGWRFAVWAPRCHGSGSLRRLRRLGGRRAHGKMPIPACGAHSSPALQRATFINTGCMAPTAVW